ncbi:TetR/AcrR family transcriptional regulator [Vibrio gallicus]|uniref:TetR/AcrR family transcriptional regulator n=1 Tax=Vibrio gallicus TaxID=190897 RepID=UPI0021C39CDA|nr:TetR/AcrR family transcriptional regulator [Vibrio gallicus]
MSSRSEKKRAQILEAAATLFTEQGYGVSMDSIARLAGVSKQTVYAHFKTKDLLFETCIQSKCVNHQIDQTALDLNMPIAEALVRFGMRFHTMLWQPEVQQTFRHAVSQLETHPTLAQIYLQSGPVKTTQVLSDYLQIKHNQGDITLTLNAQDSAMQLLLMFHGKAVYWGFLGHNCDLTQDERLKYIQDCVALFLSRALSN